MDGSDLKLVQNYKSIVRLGYHCLSIVLDWATLGYHCVRLGYLLFQTGLRWATMI